MSKFIPFSSNIEPPTSNGTVISLSKFIFNKQVIENPFVTSVNAYFSADDKNFNIKLVWLAVNKHIEDFQEGVLGTISIPLDNLVSLLNCNIQKSALGQFVDYFKKPTHNPKWIVAFTENYNKNHTEQIYGLYKGFKISFSNCNKETAINLDDILPNILEQMIKKHSFVTINSELIE